ncbi:MAG: cytochrome c4 [Gammaproteobacteria bacterium]|nr:cytochrome c4 [Gammaproteobacteria bacterium]
MKKILTLSMLIGLSGSVFAEPSSLVAYDKETRALIRSGSIDNGQKLAKSAKCKKCHSMNGIADDPDDPNIAGMSATYIFKQLKDYKDETRSEKSMVKSAKKLSDQDIADLSAYYSTQEISAAAHATESVPRLVHYGDPKRMVRACNSCHGQNGEGGMYDMPALNGQSKGYFVTTMEEFQEDDRTNDIYWRMRDIAKELTEDEIELLANYYSAVFEDDADEDEE